MKPISPEPVWGAWSKAAVRLMQERNDRFVRDYSLNGCPYQWSLEEAQMIFSRGDGSVAADLCVLGSVSECEGTFLWAWANAAIPPLARRGLDEVRTFGESNALELLSKPQWPGTRAQGLEMAAVAARLLDAAGVWAESAADVTLFFALFRFRQMG